MKDNKTNGVVLSRYVNMSGYTLRHAENVISGLAICDFHQKCDFTENRPSGEKQLRAADLSDWRVETSGIHDYNVFVTGYTLRHAKICITFLKPPQFVFHQPILVILA